MSTPGEASQPQDTRGDGPVGLSDRTEPDGQGSPDTNQSKVEPFAVQGGETGAQTPEPGSMTVGVGDARTPSTAAPTPPEGRHRAGIGGIGTSAGVPVPSSVAAEGTSEDLAPDSGQGISDDSG